MISLTVRLEQFFSSQLVPPQHKECGPSCGTAGTQSSESVAWDSCTFPCTFFASCLNSQASVCKAVVFPVPLLICHGLFMDELTVPARGQSEQSHCSASFILMCVTVFCVDRSFATWYSPSCGVFVRYSSWIFYKASGRNKRRSCTYACTLLISFNRV